ncbi:unnamed protein product [Lasius platythorax]|uniref:Uncharacterized protein n=1 Tax=Lasius platythorax TaxID=488582 RepID=A0AAV2NXF0_9HYME
MAKSSIQVKCGYCGWLLANEYQNIFDHECFKEYDETFDLLNIDENSVATIVRKESETQEDTEPLLPSQFSNIEFDEHLIMAVIDRPPLYDHRLNVKERSKLKKAELYGKKNNQW